jgi:hypothetical protein
LAGLLGLALLVLAGCTRGSGGGGERGDAPLQLQIFKAGREAIAAARATKTPELTRAVLDGVEGALLEVTLERRDQRAYLYVEARHQDAYPGQIVIWRTGDNVSLMMRSGVLFASRGLGGDILSGRVQVANGVPGPSASGEKSFDIRALDNKALRLTLVCEVADLGPKTIQIIGRNHPTRHLRETCEGGRTADGASGVVVNDYWVDRRAGLVWQSRQWAGPEVGYLRIRQVNR